MSYYTSSPITPARTLSETDLQELLLDPQEVDTLFKNVTPRIYCPSSPTATNTTSSPHSTDHFEDNHDNRVVIKDSELTCLHVNEDRRPPSAFSVLIHLFKNSQIIYLTILTKRNEKGCCHL